jgi:hypothetical protein
VDQLGVAETGVTTDAHDQSWDLGFETFPNVLAIALQGCKGDLHDQASKMGIGMLPASSVLIQAGHHDEGDTEVCQENQGELWCVSHVPVVLVKLRTQV